MSEQIVHPYHGDGVDSPATGFMIFCPACKTGHLFNTAPGPNGVGGQKPCWTFDGNMEAPTFSPSMLVRCASWPNIREDGWVCYYDDGESKLRAPKALVGSDCEETFEAVAARLGVEANADVISARVREFLDSLPPEVCHSFVRNGQIEFLSDCTHEFAGKTVPLEPF